MKTIIIIALLFISIFNISAQNAGKSLSELTGENVSLYNAVCIYNNITPGSIGMNEGRKLMAEYAKTVGLNYELYTRNGNNNMYILHYVPTTTSNVINENVTNDVVFDDVDYAIFSNENNEIIEEDIDVNINENVYTNSNKIINTDTTNNVKDNINKSVVDTMANARPFIVVKTDTIIESCYCSCDGLTIDEAYDKMKLLKQNWKYDKDNSNGGINLACRNKIRRYIESIKGENKETDVKKSNKKTVSFKFSKKKRGKRLGNGLVKKKVNILYKIFPYMACRKH